MQPEQFIYPPHSEPRELVARVAQALDLEGFFATANTEQAWWNYSFGCATVTLSPEHWQAV